MARISRSLSPDFQCSVVRHTKIWFPLILVAFVFGLPISALSQSSAKHLSVVASLPSAKLGVAYSGSASASGGVSPYHYSITRGALPNGLALDGNTGAISGVPQQS